MWMKEEMGGFLEPRGIHFEVLFYGEMCDLSPITLWFLEIAYFSQKKKNTFYTAVHKL